MDLDQAIAAHTAWKTKFRTAIAAQSQLDVATISKDNCCPLGQWLHGDGKRQYHQIPAFTECLTSHAHFHREAGKVAQLVNAKNYQQAEAALAAGTGFTAASGATGTAIVRLKREIEK